MAHKKNTTNLTELLLQCVTQPDPMLSMLEWLCTHLMEAEVDQQLGAEKSQRTDGRSGYRSEAMLVQVVQEAFVQGVSTRKMEKLAHSLGIENLSRSQGLLWSAVSESEKPRSVHAKAYHFRCSLRAGFGNPRVLSRCLMAALQGAFHADYVPQKEKKSFATVLKEIRLTPTAELARKRAYDVIDSYAKRFPKVVQCLEDGLEDSLAFYAFPMLDARKISSSNMIERLNREIRRRTSVVGIFPNESSYVRLVTTYLMEYAEDWSVSRAYHSQESIAATLLVAA